MKAIVLGSTGAVGTELTKELILQPAVVSIKLLVRRPHRDSKITTTPKVSQAIVDVFDPNCYRHHLDGNSVAFSTLGVGQPSQVSKAELVSVDLDCVRMFANECREKGVGHFSSLGAVGANPSSSIFYLKVKGQLERFLIDLGFSRVSLFWPSMIITPQNRYGLVQAITLKLYPLIDPLLLGRLSQYRSIKVEVLGQAMARNAALQLRAGVEILTWKDIQKVNASSATEGERR